LVMAIVSVALTALKFASTAWTVTLNAAPAVCPVAVPDLPVGLPGAAVSPGARRRSFAKAPALTVTDGLVLAVFEPSVASVAVTVRLPALLSVTLNVADPAASAAFDGRPAFASDVVMATVSVALTLFQYASTALTVTLNAAPAVCVVGVPVLPAELPG